MDPALEQTHAISPALLLVWFTVCAFVLLSFFFALAETALLSLGDWRVRQINERNPVLGGKLRRLLADPNDLLATLSLGNTGSDSMIVALVLSLALRQDWLQGVALTGLLLLLLIGCEMIPKTLAVRSPEYWAGRVATPLLWLRMALHPALLLAGRLNDAILAVVVPKRMSVARLVSDGEYEELVEMAFQKGSLARTEKDIILEIVRLDQQTVRDVMRPRSQMIAVPDDLTPDEMIRAAVNHRHRRLPIYNDTPDSIVGILNTRTLLLGESHDVEEAIEFPSFVPETMNLLALLKSFQRQKRGLAIVLDEYGDTAGLVTMTDILAELIGEIREEGETEDQELEPLGPGRWRVKGTMKIEDFRREHPALREHPEVTTMGGLLVAQMQVVPAAGQFVIVDGLRLTAKDVDERRVKQLLVEIAGNRTGREKGL